MKVFYGELHGQRLGKALISILWIKASKVAPQFNLPYYLHSDNIQRLCIPFIFHYLNYLSQ